MGALHHGARGVDERAGADDLVGVGVAQDALGRDLERLGEARDALELVGEVGVRGRDALQLDEVAEVLTRSRWMRTDCQSSRWRSFSTTASTPRLASSAAFSVCGSSTGMSR